MADARHAAWIAAAAALVAIALLAASNTQGKPKAESPSLNSASAFDLYPYRVPQALFDFAPESVVVGLVLERVHKYETGNPLFDALANSTSLADFYYYLAARCAVEESNSRFKQDPIFGPANTTMYLNTVMSADNHVRSVWAADAFFEAGVPAVIGPGTVLGGLLIAADYGYLNRTYLTGTNTLNQLNQQSAYGPVLRTIPTDASVTNLLARTIKQLGWTLVSFIYSDTEYGTSGGTSFLSAASTYNLNITCEFVLASRSYVTGLDEHAKCVANSDARVSVLWMSYAEAVQVIASYIQTPGLENQTFALADQIVQFVPLHQSIAAYVKKLPQDVSHYLMGSIAVIPDMGSISSYKDCIRDVNPSTTDFPNVTELWESLFACVYTGTASPTNSDDPSSVYYNPAFLLPVCPSDVRARTPRTCRCTGNESLADYYVDAKTAYVYDTVQAIVNALYEMNYNCTKVLNRVPGFAGTDFCDARVWNSSDLEQVIRFSEFLGKSGLVGFDQNEPKYSKFVVTQLDGNSNRQPVGFKEDKLPLILFENLMVWKTGTKPISQYLPTKTNLAVAIVSYVVLGLIIALSVYFSVIFWVYRDERVIKKTSPIFSQLILIGVDLACASQIVWNIPEQTDVTCFAKPILFSVGYALVLSGTIAKLYRIYVIFCTSKALKSISLNGGKKHWTISDRRLLAIPAACTAVMAVLVTLYYSLSGPPVPRESYNAANELVVQCEVPSAGVQIAFTIAIIVFAFLLAIVAAVLAFKTRNVEAAFNESLYLTFVAYSYTALSIIIVTTYYTSSDVQGATNRQMMLRTLGVVLETMITLMALFLPKTLVMFRERRERRRVQRRTLSGMDWAGGGRIYSSSSDDAGEAARATRFAACVQPVERANHDHFD